MHEFRAGWSERTEIEHERNRQVECLLANVSGDGLLNVVVECGKDASYKEAAGLIELLVRRIGRDDGTSKANQWLPTEYDVRQLVSVFSNKVESAEVPQNSVLIYLCSIAGHVAPAEFGTLLFETCRRHLDAWTTWRHKIAEWAKTRQPKSRPENPYLGRYLQSAIAAWGPDALPGLFELMQHPSALDFVPAAIGEIVNAPWAKKKPDTWFSNAGNDINEGKKRRKDGLESRQPDATFQFWTDEAAKVLGQKLSQMVEASREKSSNDAKGEVQTVRYGIGALTTIIAWMPSPYVLEPVLRAIRSDLMDSFAIVGALRGLIRQGVIISDSDVIRKLEVLYEQNINKNWLDDSSRHAMSEVTEILLCAVPPSMLSKSSSYYLHQWHLFSYHGGIIRSLGETKSGAAWPLLLELSKEVNGKGGHSAEELVHAVFSVLTPEHLYDFFALISDGRLFTWCRSGWTLERLAPRVSSILGVATPEFDIFIETCLRAQAQLADVLAGGVLSHLEEAEDTLQAYLLKALDAGRGVPGSPAYQMLERMFVLEVPVGEVQYTVTPRASNQIRSLLYAHAKGTGHIANGCKSLLASLECRRRKGGRPDDEFRHPAIEEGTVWTDFLLVGQGDIL